MSPQWLSDWWIVGCSDSDAYTTLQAASLAIHRVSHPSRTCSRRLNGLQDHSAARDTRDARLVN